MEWLSVGPEFKPQHHKKKKGKKERKTTMCPAESGFQMIRKILYIYPKYCSMGGTYPTKLFIV
jgi:hypothetical protein